MRAEGRRAEALGLVTPFLLWGLAFVILYAGHGLACGVGVRPGHYDGLTRGLLVLAFLAFLTAHATLAWAFWRRWRRPAPRSLAFIRLASLTLAVAAILTTFWTGLPVLMLSICS